MSKLELGEPVQWQDNEGAWKFGKRVRDGEWIIFLEDGRTLVSAPEGLYAVDGERLRFVDERTD